MAATSGELRWQLNQTMLRVKDPEKSIAVRRYHIHAATCDARQNEMGEGPCDFASLHVEIAELNVVHLVCLLPVRSCGGLGGEESSSHSVRPA